MRHTSGSDSAILPCCLRGSRHKLASYLVVALGFLTGTLSVFAAQASGLENPGFEDGLVKWDVTAADEVMAVGEEGPAETSTYADAEPPITVTPRGEKMARLGGYKQISESQNRGSNSISQTFFSESESIAFQVRLFSWEHRGDDTFRFDLRDADGTVFEVQGLTITPPRGNAKACTKTPCVFPIDVGKRGDFLDTDWIEFKVVGLPTDGTQLTVEFEVTGGQNEAHATWAYVDTGNTPPVAKFEISPSIVVEGDIIELKDLSFDFDPGDEIVSWEWKLVDDPEAPVVTERNGYFILPNDGTYTISLTVWDSFGASNTVTTNAYATDGSFIPPLDVDNGAPLVRVLSQEVRAGESIELLALWADPGFEDRPTVSWGGLAVRDEQVEYQNEPTIGLGVARAIFDAPSDVPPEGTTIDATVSVDDGEGGVTQEAFRITVLGSAFDRRESNDLPADAIDLGYNQSVVSTIDSPRDVDVYRVTGPGGTDVPRGSEVWIKLTGAGGNDVDLAVLSERPEDAVAAPTFYFRSPTFYFRSPTFYFRSPTFYFRSPTFYFRSPTFYFRSPTFYFRSPSFSPFADGTLEGEEIWLSNWSGLLDLPDGEDISTLDVPLAELGLADLEDAGLMVRAVSANRDPQEQLWVRVSDTDQPLYIAVVGHDGAFTGEEFYSLQVMVATPPDLPTLLGERCQGEPRVATPVGQRVRPATGTPQTLVVMAPRERYQATYPAADVDAMLAKLEEFAADELVNADILELPSDIYEGFDRVPCSVDAANATAAAIRTRVLAHLEANPSIENLVILGVDDMVPHWRSPDATHLNERDYVLDSFLRAGTPLHASIYGGYNLTDHHLADRSGTSINGTYFYAPKLALGRVVESPLEITAQLERFIDSRGVFAATDFGVTAYDFFIEDGLAMFEYLTGVAGVDPARVNTLLSYPTDAGWSATELRCLLLGSLPGCEASDFVSLNAHMSHYLLESALGFNSDSVAQDLMASTEYSATENAPGIVIANGCHVGFPVPDGSSIPSADELGEQLGIDFDLDWPQAMAQKGTALVGSLGYGLGVYHGSAGTELLMRLIAQKSLEGKTHGQALSESVEDYISRQSAFSDYDVKSLIQTTLYGLPMARSTVVSAAPAAAPAAAGTSLGTVQITVEDGDTTHLFQPTLLQEDTDDGAVVSADGETQATAWRPILPRVFESLGAGQSAHGILLKSGSFEDTEYFNPVITLFTQEWVIEDNGEGANCLRAFWPSVQANLNTYQTAEGLQQSLVVLPVQFLCVGLNSANDVVGTLRVPSALSFELLRSDSDDVEPPLVREIKLRPTADGTGTLVTVEGRDTDVTDDDPDAEIRRIVVTVIDEASGTMYSTDTLALSGEITGVGPFQVAVDVPYADAQKRLFIQVVDDANNVTHWTSKGVYARGILVDAGESQLISPLYPTQLSGTVFGFSDLLEEGATASDQLTGGANVYYRWDFGDGTYQSGTLAQDGVARPFVTVNADGSATFTVGHQYDLDPEELLNLEAAKLKVWTNFGGNGEDEVTLLACVDSGDNGAQANGDLTLCGVDNAGTEITVVLAVAGVIADDWQYRVHLDLGANKSGGTPLDGKSDLMLKYNGGQLTGLKSLAAEADGNTLTLTFNLKDLKWQGTRFGLYIESQKGVAGEPNTGFDDRLPDEGFLEYNLR